MAAPVRKILDTTSYGVHWKQNPKAGTSIQLCGAYALRGSTYTLYILLIKQNTLSLGGIDNAKFLAVQLKWFC
jgi:hypothetical protein